MVGLNARPLELVCTMFWSGDIVVEVGTRESRDGGILTWDVVEGEINKVGIPLKEGRMNHLTNVGRAFKMIMGLVHFSYVEWFS